MISAPLADRVDASDPADGATPIERLEGLPDDEYARQRLSGTIWERGPAPALYRGVLALGRGLSAVGISADALTFVSLALAGVAGVAVATGNFVAAALLVLFSGFCDALDGIVARASHKASRYGALLDSTVDRLSDGLPLLGVVVFYAGERLVVAIPALTMMGAFTVSYVRARSEALGGKLPPLFMRRAERVVLLVLTFFLGSVHVDAIPVRAPLLLAGVAVIGLLSFVGAWSALRSARSILATPRPINVSEPSE